MSNDHGFSKACPSGNHMIDGFRSSRRHRGYSSLQEDQDMEDYYDRKEQKEKEKK